MTPSRHPRLPPDESGCFLPARSGGPHRAVLLIPEARMGFKEKTPHACPRLGAPPTPALIGRVRLAGHGDVSDPSRVLHVHNTEAPVSVLLGVGVSRILLVGEGGFEPPTPTWKAGTDLLAYFSLFKSNLYWQWSADLRPLFRSSPLAAVLEPRVHQCSPKAPGCQESTLLNQPT